MPWMDIYYFDDTYMTDGKQYALSVCMVNRQNEYFISSGTTSAENPEINFWVLSQCHNYYFIGTINTIE